MIRVPWRDASGSQPKTRQEWFQELAADALREGQGALGAGDLLRARSWLERAHRIAPTDVTASLSLAVVLLRAGEPAHAVALLEPMGLPQVLGSCGDGHWWA